MDFTQFTEMSLHLRPKLTSLTGKILAYGGATEAEDVVQETMMKLWMMREQISDNQQTERLAMTIARRIAIDHTRHGAFCPGISPEDVDKALDPEAEEMLRQADMMITTSHVLSALPPRQAMVMRMRHIDGLENEQIAAMTGISEGNVRVLLSRARSNARDYIIRNKKRIQY